MYVNNKCNVYVYNEQAMYVNECNMYVNNAYVRE